MSRHNNELSNGIANGIAGLYTLWALGAFITAFITALSIVVIWTAMFAWQVIATVVAFVFFPWVVGRAAVAVACWFGEKK